MKFKERFRQWRLPKPRKDAQVYVSHGDIHWGNSIVFRSTGREGELAITGWLARAPSPEPGDVVLVRMRSGKWAQYVFTMSAKATGVDDMFQGYARGPIGYATVEPKTQHCDEFVPDLGLFFR